VPDPAPDIQPQTSDPRVKIACSHTELVPTGSLTPHPRNPKTHPQAQIEAFKSILLENGIRRPVVVSRLSGCIVAGHGLWQALTELGVELCPVDFQDFADEAHELAHLTADNQLGTYGVTNDLQLQAIVNDLSAAGMDRAIAGILADIGVKEEKDEPAEVNCAYPLVPDYDEGYNGVIIFCKTEIEWAQLQTLIEMPKMMGRSGAIGHTRVIAFRDFFRQWSARPPANQPTAQETVRCATEGPA
jgi:hypothetical protein